MYRYQSGVSLIELLTVVSTVGILLGNAVPMIDDYYDKKRLIAAAEMIYGQLTRVALVEHLRGEVKFDGLDALKAQIERDGVQAREILEQPENAVHFFHHGNGGH